MRKFLVILLAAIFALSACSGNGEEEVESTKENETDEDGSVDVDKGLLNVEVTIPSSFLEGEDKEEVIAEAEDAGVSEVEENDDGSLTYKMSKSTHKEMMGEIKTSIQETIDEIVNDEDYASIEDITANDSFSKFTLSVNQEEYENSLDGLATFSLAVSALYYQLFDGVDADDYDVEILMENIETNEVFDSVVYPEAFEDMEESWI